MSTEVAYDVPNRADSVVPGTTDSGLAWFTPGGINAMYVSSNRFTGVIGTGVYQHSMAGLPVVSSDNGVFAVINALPPSGAAYLYCRWNGGYSGSEAFPSSGYTLRIDQGAGGTSTLYSGAGSLGSTGVTFAAGDEVGLVVKGNVIYVIKNGVVRYTFTDNGVVSGSNVGVGTRCSGAGQGYFTTIRAVRIDLDPSLPYRLMMGWKMGWHVDGSTHPFGAGAAALNSETGGSAAVTPPAGAAVVFPEPRIVTGIFLAGTGGFSGSVIRVEFLQPDGVTWAGAGYFYDTGYGGYGTLPAASAWRTSALLAGNTSLVRGVRLNTLSGTLYSYHLYGYIPQAAGVHRLRLWHPYLDIPLPGDYFDLDDIGRNTLRTRKFRIKNQSLALTANSISVDVRSDAYGTTLTDQFGLRKTSDSVGVYVPTATLGSIAPNTVSEIFEWRRITPSGQAYQVEAPFVRIQTGSFS